MEFVLSSKGKRILIYENFVYYKQKNSADGNSEYWQCIERKSRGCAGRIRSRNENAIPITNHSHPADPSIIKSFKVKAEVQRHALQTGEPTTVIVNQALLG